MNTGKVVGSNPIGSAKSCMKFALFTMSALFFVSGASFAQNNSAPPIKSGDGAAATQPAGDLKSDPIGYLSSKIRVWTRDDAEDELGRATQRGTAVDIQTDNVIGDTFKYKTTVGPFGEVDLTFDHDSRLLSVIYLYPKGALASSTMRDALGKNFIKFTNPKGTPSYVYQQRARTISIQADLKDDVANIMIW